MELPCAEPLIELHLTVARWRMHTNRVGIGVEADQQKIDGCATAEAVLHRFTEIEQPLMTS